MARKKKNAKQKAIARKKVLLKKQNNAPLIEQVLNSKAISCRSACDKLALNMVTYSQYKNRLKEKHGMLAFDYKGMRERKEKRVKTDEEKLAIAKTRFKKARQNAIKVESKASQERLRKASVNYENLKFGKGLYEYSKPKFIFIKPNKEKDEFTLNN